MAYPVSVLFFGESRSFPRQELPFENLVEAGRARVLILAGDGAGRALAGLDTSHKAAVLVELGTECLGVYAGEGRGEEGSNCLGFARFRLGIRAPSNLVELVRQPRTDPAAVVAAREAFEAAGLQTAVCSDFPGRIIDRLARSFYNAVLQSLDEQLASADDLDLTIRLGLGHPEGPIGLLETSGLAEHCDVSRALYEAYGEPSLLPARRARNARAARELRQP